MKRNILITGIVMIVIGFITARVGDSLSTVAESGVVQDSMLMPIGAILSALGFLTLVIVIFWYLISFIISRLKKS
jgi:hypothetical protein